MPAKWYATIAGVFFGSIALITINGEKDGYGKSAITAIGLSPILSIIAGAMLPKNTPIELAALAGGIAALGGTALVLGVAKRAPGIFEAALTGAANAYLNKIDNTPDDDAGKHSSDDKGSK